MGNYIKTTRINKEKKRRFFLKVLKFILINFFLIFPFNFFYIFFIFTSKAHPSLLLYQTINSPSKTHGISPPPYDQTYKSVYLSLRF